jgi:hypothetical protein
MSVCDMPAPVCSALAPMVGDIVPELRGRVLRFEFPWS